MGKVVIDGSSLEGGGQILRNAISFSAVSNTAIEVTDIRAGRPKPGLSNQHLFGLELAAKTCNAELTGCFFKSKNITFIPKNITAGEFECNVPTAGSISLLMQISVPILAFAKSKSVVLLRGGTNASFAPFVDYMTDVTLFYYQKFGIDFRTEILHRGYYPKGGGSVRVEINPIVDKLSPINLTDLGSIVKITGSAFVAGKVPIKVAEEIRRIGYGVLRSHFPNIPVEINTFRAPDNPAHGSASAFMFVVETSTGCRFGVSGLGSSRGPAVKELVTSTIENELVPCIESGACCDNFMQDQLILPMALAQGTSVIRTTPLTLHTQSAIYVAEQILPSVKFNIESLPNQKSILLSCTGAGIKPS